MEKIEKCTVAMLGGPCSQHVTGNTSRLNQPQSAIILSSYIITTGLWAPSLSCLTFIWYITFWGTFEAWKIVQHNFSQFWTVFPSFGREKLGKTGLSQFIPFWTGKTGFGREKPNPDVMAWRLFGAKPLPEPMLTYCQLDPGKKCQWNLSKNSKIFIQENAFENVVCEMAAILSRGRWVSCFVTALAAL